MLSVIALRLGRSSSLKEIPAQRRVDDVTRKGREICLDGSDVGCRAQSPKAHASLHLGQGSQKIPRDSCPLMSGFDCQLTPFIAGATAKEVLDAGR